MKKQLLLKGGGLTVCLLCLMSVCTRAQPGDIDPNFTIGSAFNHSTQSVAIQNDGKIIVTGAFSDYNTSSVSSIVRLNHDGSVDPTFVLEGSGFNNSVSSMCLQDDGKIVVGGIFTEYNGFSRNSIARLNSNGSLDSSFNPGTGFDSDINAIIVQPDGKIIIGGSFNNFDGVARNKIVRVHSNGAIDLDFNPGTGFNRAVQTLAIQTDGKIIVGGEFATFNGSTRNHLARLDPDGGLDANFATSSGFNDWVTTCDIQDDGKIVVGGYFTSVQGTSRSHLARLNIDGSVDLGFASITNFSPTVHTLQIQSDGKIVAGGIFVSMSGGSTKFLRFDSDGSLDGSFYQNHSFDTAIKDIAISTDGRIVAVGQFRSIDGVTYNRIARFHGDCEGTDGVALSEQDGVLTVVESNANYQWIDCGTNNSSISGENNQSYSPGAAGQYACQVSKASCSYQTACTESSITSLLDPFNPIGFELFPNPTSESVTISGLDEKASLVIFNARGHQVLQAEITSDQPTTIALTDLPKGVYTFRILNHQGLQMAKQLLIQ